MEVSQPKPQYIFPVQLRHVYDETLVGAVDGVNKQFKTVHNFVDGYMTLYLNGLKQREGATNDYIEISDDTIEFQFAPLPGDIIVADYLRKN